MGEHHRFCPMCGCECATAADLAASQFSNRELTRQVEQMRATLERIGAMSVRFTCACGRPTGIGAIKSCADKALAALTAPPSSSATGRADTGREER